MTSYKALKILTVIFVIIYCIGANQVVVTPANKIKDIMLHKVVVTPVNKIKDMYRKVVVSPTDDTFKDCEDVLQIIGLHPESVFYNFVYVMHFGNLKEFQEDVKKKIKHLYENNDEKKYEKKLQKAGEIVAGNSQKLYETFDEAKKKFEKKKKWHTPNEYCDCLIDEMYEEELQKAKKNCEYQKGYATTIMCANENDKRDYKSHGMSNININDILNNILRKKAKCKKEIQDFKLERDNKELKYDESNIYNNITITIDIYIMLHKVVVSPTDDTFKVVVSPTDDTFKDSLKNFVENPKPVPKEMKGKDYVFGYYKYLINMFSEHGKIDKKLTLSKLCKTIYSDENLQKKNDKK